MSDSPQVAEETIDIEAAGSSASIRMLGATIASLHIRGDAAAEYQWDARRRGGDWIENVGPEYTGSADYDDVHETGDVEVRVRCSSGTGTAGDQATITLMAGGG
ncbi:hypothetical protein [Natrinema salsiterrestre]|uniref:Uncharacterized protein n=1 Tax=Natrinema salsiterrestre TaxID=2950540 RepID=A0A9Q4Q5A3_9EURY|nr:hypothetical protein [Natrinema salsiterrestre]MDF9748367.1 hypothetical protein [Natrinema salsiterrestre]